MITMPVEDLGEGFLNCHAEHINGHGDVVGLDAHVAGHPFVPIGWIAYDALGVGPADVTTQGAGVGDPGYGVPDQQITGTDINYYVNFWVAGDLAIADVTTQGAAQGDPGYGVPDGLDHRGRHQLLRQRVARQALLVAEEAADPAARVEPRRSERVDSACTRSRSTTRCQICGTGVCQRHEQRAFLMTPIQNGVSEKARHEQRTEQPGHRIEHFRRRGERRSRRRARSTSIVSEQPINTRRIRGIRRLQRSPKDADRPAGGGRAPT